MSAALQVALTALMEEIAECERIRDEAIARRLKLMGPFESLRDLLEADVTGKPVKAIKATTVVAVAPKKAVAKPKAQAATSACPTCGKVMNNAGHAMHRKAGCPGVKLLTAEAVAAAETIGEVLLGRRDDRDAVFGRVVERPVDEVEVFACLDCDFTTVDMPGELARHTLNAHDRAPMVAERQPELRPRTDVAS